MSTIQQVQQALAVMSSTGADKPTANAYLENFQKSAEAWDVTHTILADAEFPLELKYFAAQTMRSKIIYDLNQVPATARDDLKNSVLQLMLAYDADSHKIIRTQLCISLANLAIQMLDWANPTADIVTFFCARDDARARATLLEFLRVLPEEMCDVKKTPLTDDEFAMRATQLLTANADAVIGLLSGLAADPTPAFVALLLDCLNSWLKEVEVLTVLSNQPLTDVIFRSLAAPATFDASVECLVTVLRETRDMEIEDHHIVQSLLDQLLALKPFMDANLTDQETMAGLTRLFVEAGESWHPLIAANPTHFAPLVALILACCAPAQDVDTVKVTFYFWYTLKQLLTVLKFAPARTVFTPVYTQLIHYIIAHLRYPENVDDAEANACALDLFDDKEEEDKFKDFRYEMGDVLKDCCVVVGATNALQIPYQQITEILASSSASWQSIEAPLFSMRAMAKEIPLKENKILPAIMNLLVQLPEHFKIRYATTLVLGRYTQWTAKHPEFLEPQLNYIIAGFGDGNKEVMTAASHALMYFCQDCSSLLVSFIEQLYTFYTNVQSQDNGLDLASVYEIVDGVAHILKVQPLASVYDYTRMFVQPTVDKLEALLTDSRGVDTVSTEIADQLESLAIFFDVLRPSAKDYDLLMSNNEIYPVAKLFGELWPLITRILAKYGHVMRVSERCLKVVKNALVNYNLMLQEVLPAVLGALVLGFAQTKFGCYLWVSGVVVREFADDGYDDTTARSDERMKTAIYEFAATQIAQFFSFFTSDVASPLDIPDIIDDFYRMMNDLLMFYPFKLIANQELVKSSIDASVYALSHLQSYDPITHILHYLIDLVAWGFKHPPVSMHETNPVEIQQAVQEMVAREGAQIVSVLINGLVYKFPRDSHPDTSELLVKMFTLPNIHANPDTVIQWIDQALLQLGNVSEEERNKLVSVLGVALTNKDARRMRGSIKDFVGWYTRKHVMARNEFK
ncbi:hypothetical protein BABINDRAFT_159722 [Babjeviella inositovora NRRL Y-12698]|uniref:Importin N-terminal domain-containing protein n=1 Tax=Babjeviella inositovora NRRL Y-12698 TaxID=984486 RepID=A0A1E3QUQ2_9ASCO|nr:uncharacterized protein BABINDRAFT_159722 [Babjeviella inositovora NRRL Y-12698]ODQ81426.1 hypothetical protein BABINDRAFT_159722 [Babjeviella inositovora NRRL Y-12698]